MRTSKKREENLSEFSLEMGKLMAQVDGLQKQLADIKKDVSSTKTQITSVHAELLNFMGTVQKKSVCQVMHDKLNKEFIMRREIAPIKAILNVIAATTITAICIAIMDLILK